MISRYLKHVRGKNKKQNKTKTNNYQNNQTHKTPAGTTLCFSEHCNILRQFQFQAVTSCSLIFCYSLVLRVRHSEKTSITVGGFLLSMYSTQTEPSFSKQSNILIVRIPQFQSLFSCYLCTAYSKKKSLVLFKAERLSLIHI